jgi:hypothetical protein
MGDTKEFLKLKVIWTDDDMLELQVTAFNGHFLGTTEVYDTDERLSQFADSLIGFPKTTDSTLTHEAGERDSYSFFSMKFYTIDSAGHLGVQVSIESNVPTKFRPEEKDKLTMELKTEPSCVDTFIKSLVTLVKNRDGEAILNGVNC